MAEYGIPYMGSKGLICNELIKIFPRADNFYDLFGGGFSVTNAMLVKRYNQFKEFHFNEIRPGICDLIKNAIAGNYNYDRYLPEFVDRETFKKNVNSDIFITIIWSFGNQGSTYLFSKEIEPYKKSMHNAIVFNKFDDLAKKVLCMEKFKDGFDIKDKRLFLRNKIETYRKNGVPKFLLPFLKEGQLERLQKLQQLRQLERLHFYNDSYENIPIKDNSIIYCDPPYFGTAEYDNKFDHKKFYEWADSNIHPIFISEYWMPDEFKEIFSIKKRSLLGGKKQFKEEKLFVNKSGLIYLQQERRKRFVLLNEKFS